ncbi:unnamed protein product, partial [Protopolystoma xenopodis]
MASIATHIDAQLLVGNSYPFCPNPMVGVTLTAGQQPNEAFYTPPHLDSNFSYLHDHTIMTTATDSFSRSPQNVFTSAFSSCSSALSSSSPSSTSSSSSSATPFASSFLPSSFSLGSSLSAPDTSLAPNFASASCSAPSSASSSSSVSSSCSSSSLAAFSSPIEFYNATIYPPPLQLSDHDPGIIFQPESTEPDQGRVKKPEIAGCSLVQPGKISASISTENRHAHTIASSYLGALDSLGHTCDRLVATAVGSSTTSSLTRQDYDLDLDRRVGPTYTERSATLSSSSSSSLSSLPNHATTGFYALGKLASTETRSSKALQQHQHQ